MHDNLREFAQMHLSPNEFDQPITALVLQLIKRGKHGFMLGLERLDERCPC